MTLSHSAKSTTRITSRTGIQAGDICLKSIRIQELHFSTETPHTHLGTPPRLPEIDISPTGSVIQKPHPQSSFEDSRICRAPLHLHSTPHRPRPLFESSLDICQLSHQVHPTRRNLYWPRCLEITSLAIGIAHLRRQAPFGPLRLEILAPAITYEPLLTWGLSPLLLCQEGA